MESLGCSVNMSQCDNYLPDFAILSNFVLVSHKLFQELQTFLFKMCHLLYMVYDWLHRGYILIDSLYFSPIQVIIGNDGSNTY